MPEIHIQPAVMLTLQSCLGPIREQSFGEIAVKCGCCGTPVRFPLIAHEEDARAFQQLMDIASKVLERHGVTAMLLSEVQAACHIELAKRKSAEDDQ